MTEQKPKLKIKSANYDLKEFAVELSKKKVAPVIYLIYNESDSESAEFIDSVKLELNIVDDNIYIYLGEEMDLNQFITDYCNVPLFGDKRLFIIKNLNNSKQKRDKKLVESFLRLLEEPQQENYIIITNPYISEKKYTDLIYKTLLNSAVIKIKEGNVIQWIKDYAEKNRKNIDMQAAKKLFALCNEKKNNIKSELDKLFLYCLNEKEITLEVISKTVQNYDEDNIFNLLDNIILRQYEKSVIQYRELLNKRVSANVILFNLIEKLNKLIYFKETAVKMKYIGDSQLDQICAIIMQKYKLPINYYEKYKLKTFAAKYDFEKLKLFLKYMIELD
ncbi:hypothetical protein KA977_09235, partial [Candidatus Dependentiae bacterium]|nr:hypothetical protein [Candidatus Dependentiae bacterium]